jgi:hypothetical protein
MDAKPVVPGLWAVKIRFVNAYRGASVPFVACLIKLTANYPQFEYSCPMKSKIGDIVIETESFIKQAAALWSAAELDDLKDHVARNPLADDEIPGTGGSVRPGRHGEARWCEGDLLLL